jgi:hypothetical protein
VPSWPTIYGGAGLSVEEAKILAEEMRSIKAPLPLVGMGTAMIRPTLLELGDDDQKARHLPKITSGETRWCQGYSEPGAGSDLASLQTKAVADGDDYMTSAGRLQSTGPRYRSSHPAPSVINLFLGGMLCSMGRTICFLSSAGVPKRSNMAV